MRGWTHPPVPLEATVDHLSRRRFLVLTGVGASAVGIGSAAEAATPSAATKLPQGASGALVAHVSDVRKDELVLMVGEHEVVVHDSDLVARLARAVK